MRIVGGRLKGRTLLGPKSDAIRPTSDRLRESLFNVLAHAYDDACQGARVVDLFAGTGALAIEALSRGAVYAAFVDQSAEGRGLIRGNVDALGLSGITGLLKRDATKLGPLAPFEPFSLAFLDPPYRKGLAELALISLRDGGWLTRQALVIVEEAAEVTVDLPDGFTLLEKREAGDSQILILRAA
ncbi:16S rRNA (guanine(966)-N(2))-methyltransferase RsmD [Phreatobacter aquaticus]|uniref:16S rRNA (Guanine(966)-N(2))-methyltransferase RsmD n=1 Tax=Phreatobacter aquaticus TaxID=2570229 RepID=A0A4D7QL01_9HYPH|nr:16S rRNA (guanine(966)-N(2))-methyltransferase RsmD [Phreatobacter aquaticus]QCK86036.1 16S rRNA (guanine(966)-N(2))-methyltransferase RsmD [Phreatobacter aquaticus]